MAQSELREDATAATQAKAVEISGILQRTYYTIRTISLLPGVRSGDFGNRASADQDAVAMGRISPADYSTVQQLYNQIAASVAVSEIYIVHDGFRPDRGEVPFLMFDEVIVDNIRKNLEAEGIKTGSDVPPEDESEEYADYVRQLDYLHKNHPTMPANAPGGIVPVNSAALRTCDNTQYTSIAHGDVEEASGFSLSVPIYDLQDQRFKGLVTAVLRHNIFEAALRGISEVPVFKGTGKVAPRASEPVNYLLEQKSSGIRIFDRDNVRLRSSQGRLDDEFFHNSVDLKLPGNFVWTLHDYVSQAQRDQALAPGRNRATSQAALLTLALVLAWLFVHLVLRQQANARRHAENRALDMTAELERLAQVARHTSNAVSITDRKGHITWTNAGFTRMTGYEAQEALGRSLGELLCYGQSDPSTSKTMTDAIAEGTGCRTEILNRAKDGRSYWAETEIQPQYDAAGQCKGFMEISRDISERRLAAEALRWSQSLMDKMSNSSPLAFLVVDNRSDEILYFNQRFCEIWGIEHLAERMRRKELKNNDIIPDCLPVLVDVPAFAESCKPLQFEDNRITLEDEIAFSDNRTVRRFTTQIRDVDDQYYGRFYIFEEVTERKRAELALTQATQAAQAASLSKSQFLANMSHEIRTPMNAILGMLTLLRKTELTARQADYAAKSDGAARALLGLLNEILDFSKIEAGKMTLDPHPFAVDQLLRDLSVILSTSVGEKPVEVLFDIDPALPRQLVGDAMRLQQVLLNLGSNAIKFTARGEVVIAIQVVQATDDVVTLQFSVRDSGIGIAPENQARIFSGFTQAEASTTRRFGGSGLGVVISQRFVSLMGGELELHSELGTGSRFYFTVTLPIAAGSDENEHRRARSDTASWRVLVIDDNPNAREVLEHMGQSLGWQVDLAESGEQALDRLQQHTRDGINYYQAVFVDWSMPDMDGWQTSLHIRELLARNLDAADAGGAPVVVMVTAHGREALSRRSQAEQSLLDGFLVKPVTASMLFDAVIDARTGRDHAHPSRVAVQVAERRLVGMRLLVVEDNLNNQQVARELLEGEGALIQVANHGKEAVEAIAAADPAFDVVLMDLQMPVMDGFAATKVIRNDLGFALLPIVAMTANAMASDREACLAVGMNDHVGKPFDLDDLVRVLRRQARWGEALAAPVGVERTLDQGVAQAAANAGVDLNAALRRLGGRQDVYRRMLQTFVKDLQAMPAQLQEQAQSSAQAHAPDDAIRLLHSLKGLAATLGAMKLSAEAASAEKMMAGSPTAELISAATTQACSAIASALPCLQALLEALQLDHVAGIHGAGEGSGAQPLDKLVLAKSLQAMGGLLAAWDMGSTDVMAELQQQFGQALGEDLVALEQAMAALDFESALPLCNALLAKYA